MSSQTYPWKRARLAASLETGLFATDAREPLESMLEETWEDDDMVVPKIDADSSHDPTIDVAPKIDAESHEAPKIDAERPSSSAGPGIDVLPHDWHKCGNSWLCYVCMGISKGEPKRLTGCQGPPESWREAWLAPTRA